MGLSFGFDASKRSVVKIFRIFSSQDWKSDTSDEKKIIEQWFKLTVIYDDNTAFALFYVKKKIYFRNVQIQPVYHFLPVYSFT